MKLRVFLVAVTAALLVTARQALPPILAAAQLQTIIVTSTADSGPGTLREALTQAPPDTLIAFDHTVFPPGNPTRISLLSPLPELWQGSITIDASNAGVILDGGRLPPEEGGSGLTINSNGNVIRGLQILGFPEHGIRLYGGAQNNTIGGNSEDGAGPSGQGNTISGNGVDGVCFEGVSTDHNLVIGNLIGTDATGRSALGNGFHGVAIIRGAQYNQIGGATTGERNIISGNAWDGVFIHDSGTMFNAITGNYVGTDASGTTPLPNGNFGINLGDSAQRNLVGGGTAAEGNVISGNGGGGVVCAGGGVRDNTIRGNFIGLDTYGNQPLPNFYGVLIDDGASQNVVQGNVVSSNRAGVTIAGTATLSNTVKGNFIGTNAAGDAAIGNEIDGVWIGEGAQHNIIGGGTPEERNLVSGNLNNGVVIDAAAHNTISGNYIGTDATGNAALGNGNIGLVLAWGSQYNLIGGSRPGEGNVISGNSSVGVSIANSDTMSNTVSGNYIGTDPTGTIAIGNSLIGVHMNDGAQYNVLGGSTPGRANLIGGNGMAGVRIEGSDTTANVVTGNYIGTDLSGETDLGNMEDGVHLANGAWLNFIGPGNTIAYNKAHGVNVLGPTTLGNAVTANSIYANGESGILNGEGGNEELSAPTITYVSTRTIRGTAPPHSRVEIFSDDEGQGRIFQGSTTADAEGTFIFTLTVGTSLGPNVTATAIDGTGNTSQFSAPARPRAHVVTRELPGIVGPAQVSVEPEVVGTNLTLALFCVLFFGITSNIFNTILREYRDELARASGRLIPQAARDAARRVSSSLGNPSGPGRGKLASMWLLLLLLTSVIESFLDPEVGVLSPDRLRLLTTLFLSALAVSGLELGSDLLAHRRWAPTTKAEGRLQWVGIGVALACVVLSRVLDFRPGYLYGIVGAIYLVPRLAGIPRSGKRATLVLMAVLAGGLALWIATAFLPPVLAELEPLFLTAFLISLEGVFFALVPLAFAEGGDIWGWRKGVWSVFFAVVLFCFYHFALNPSASDVQAIQQNGVRTLLVLVVVFGLATLMLWVLFPLRLGRGKLQRPAGPAIS
jgi:hypothetical protein